MIVLQDEVNEKVVSLCIRGGKISAQILKSALLKTLTKLEQQKSQRKQKKGVSKEEKNLAVYKGKQSMEKLIESNSTLRQFKNQLLMDVTTEGLRIQIIDEKNRPMFDTSSAELKP